MADPWEDAAAQQGKQGTTSAPVDANDPWAAAAKSKSSATPKEGDEAKPGVLDKADAAINSTLATNPKNLSSFGKTNLIEAPKTLGRELYGGVKSILQTPSAMWHAISDEAQPGEPSGVPERAIYRMAGKPIQTAIEDYSSGRVTPQAALENAPEALGTAGAQMIAGKAIDVAAPKAADWASGLPAKQAALTIGKTLANSDVTKPFKAMSKIPEYWRDSSPEGQALAETKQAVRERRASMIPLRVPSRAIAEGAGSPATASPTFVPEPRGDFTGENQGYMASVPRNELGRLALARKPGAAAQMQQLGRPIIYIPNGAELPGRMAIPPYREESQ